MAWISQGLEKVVPQPELKSKEPTAAEQPQVRPPEAPPSNCHLRTTSETAQGPGGTVQFGV